MSGPLRLAVVCSLVALFALPAAAQDRWILAGDSIQTNVFDNPEYGLVGGDARDLTASIVTQQTGVTIQNFSSPGARMTTFGYFAGLNAQKPAISYIDGFFGAKGIVITIGVNDSGPDTDPAVYSNDYLSFVQHARQASLEVVCVLPLNEPNEVADVNVSRRFNIQLRTYFACIAAGVPAANVFNPAAAGIYPDDANPAKERLFAPDHVHLTSDGHALFAEKLIDFMVGRGYWTRS